jgi:hypothetical protein
MAPKGKGAKQATKEPEKAGAAKQKGGKKRNPPFNSSQPFLTSLPLSLSLHSPKHQCPPHSVRETRKERRGSRKVERWCQIR